MEQTEKSGKKPHICSIAEKPESSTWSFVETIIPVTPMELEPINLRALTKKATLHGWLMKVTSRVEGLLYSSESFFWRLI